MVEHDIAVIRQHDVVGAYVSELFEKAGHDLGTAHLPVDVNQAPDELCGHLVGRLDLFLDAGTGNLHLGPDENDDPNYRQAGDQQMHACAASSAVAGLGRWSAILA